MQVRAIDKWTVEFTLITPGTFRLHSLAKEFVIFPREAVEAFGDLEDWENAVGSGPFMIEEVQMNDFVTFVPFQDYHGGVAKVDQIVAYPSGENDGNVLKNAAAGRLDFGFTKSVADVQALEDMDHMRVIPADIPYTRSLRVNSYPNKPE